MRSRTIVLVSAAALAAGLAGCKGPGPKGEENRAAAMRRMNLINSDLMYDQAVQAFEAGQLDRALEDVKQAIARSPETARYHVMMGRIQLESHRLDRAFQCFEKAIELDPECHEAFYCRGIVYERWSKDELAAESHHHAFELDSSDLSYLLAAAECEVALGRLDIARSILERRMKYFENHASIHQLLGQIAMIDGDPETAVQRFRQARLLLPEDEMLLKELCRAQLAAGDLKSVLDSVRRLQLSEQTPSLGLLRLEARCLAELGRQSEARAVYTEITRQFPEETEAWVDLATAAHRLGDLRRVAQCSQRLAMLAPDRWEGPFFKGLVLRNQGRSDEAIAEFEKAIELAPEQTLPRLMLGLEQKHLGRSGEAYRAFVGSLRLEPDHPVARRLAAEVRPEID
ncbi:MAG: tetratricopeptide repeat protein [Planctomycetota bacterium]|jgi:tetratricopeptide (TPR) repeat protein